jgi:outer membrane cobalamin receptor
MAIARTLIPALLGTLIFADVSAEQERLEEILVTATRRTVSIAEVSSGITLVDGAAARANKLVTDALDVEVGVYLQQTTPGQGAAIIRGLKGSSILHLVDGIRLNNAIFRSAPTQYFALVPTSAVERIEVLRGTPASLYGSDAVGGVVQLVTRTPRFDPSQTGYRGEVYAAYDTAELGRMLSATVDAGSSRIATSFSAASTNWCPDSARPSHHPRSSCSSPTGVSSCTASSPTRMARLASTGTSILRGNGSTMIACRAISERRTGFLSRIAAIFTAWSLAAAEW